MEVAKRGERVTLVEARELLRAKGVECAASSSSVPVLSEVAEIEASLARYIDSCRCANVGESAITRVLQRCASFGLPKHPDALNVANTFPVSEPEAAACAHSVHDDQQATISSIVSTCLHELSSSFQYNATNTPQSNADGTHNNANESVDEEEDGVGASDAEH